MRIICFVLALLAAAASATAAPQVPQRLAGEHGRDVGFTIAQAVHVVQLVRSQRMIELDRSPFGRRNSDLRVSIVVLDAGTSTDLSPRLDIHIAMFNDVMEHGLAWAVEPVISVFAFHGVRRAAPGIYEVDVTTLNPEGPSENCTFIREKVVIDARELSVLVRRASGLDEFQIQRYAGPIAMSEERLGCTRL